MIVGIGIDLEDVDRVRRSIERFGARFLERVYTPAEIAYVEAKANKYERYAARFAAKEAGMKALGTGWDQGVHWKHLEVVNSPEGCPKLLLSGGARRRADALGATRTHISMSHTRARAVAQVVLER